MSAEAPSFRTKHEEVRSRPSMRSQSVDGSSELDSGQRIRVGNIVLIRSLTGLMVQT